MILDKFTTKQKFIAAVAVQLIFLFSIIIFKLSILSGGTDVFLRIMPIDPRDPLRGDHVIVNYKISSVYSNSSENIWNGELVYVTLENDTGKFWMASRVSSRKPTDGSIFIKGTVINGGSDSSINSRVPQKYNSNLTIKYGIEDIYIPEGSGQNFNFRNKEAGVLVSVGDNGDAVAKRIYIDGNPWP